MISPIQNEIDELLDEYTETRRYVEEEKPYWMNVTGGTTFSGPLRIELENYFPDAHYRKAVDQAFEVLAEERLETDGGTRQKSEDDRVWFWYNPDMDSVLQESVGPYDVRGMFNTEEDAYRFINWYADRYDIPDTTYFELYSADLRHEGFGRKHVLEQEEAGKEVDENTPQQADFDRFYSQDDEGGS